MVRHMFEQLSTDLYRKARTIGFWFLFFGVLYLIVLFKVVTTSFSNEAVFFKFYGVLITVYILSRFLLAYLSK